MVKCGLLATALVVALCGAAHADVMDDELGACKALLVSGKSSEAAVRLAALETKGRSETTANPANAHAQFILGMAAMYLGHDDPAKAALDAAVRLEPKNLVYLLGRSQFAIYTDAPRDAVKLLTQALADNAKNLELLEMLGHAQQGADMYAEAQQTFQTASDLAPTEPRFIAEVAECLVGAQKLDDALAKYAQALQVNPKYAVALLSMSRIYQSRKDWDKAIGALRQVLTIDPGDYRTQARIVQLCEAAGKIADRDAARDAIFQMHKAGKDDDDSFCREQFSTDANLIVVMERFDFVGPRAIRYSFNIASPDGKTVEKVVSLGSYMDVTALAREHGEIAAGERMYHLDLYTEDGHDVLKMFTREPTYEQTRDLVRQYLAGTLKPLPAAVPANQPATGAKP